jgi:undecaprenyl diphosphate synthase
MKEIPQHVAIIMDGNGRWAKQHHRPRIFGHRAGQKSSQRAIEFAAQQGVKTLTLFVFGQENWQRPEAEVSALLSILLNSFDEYVPKLQQQGIKLTFIGARDNLSAKLKAAIVAAEEKTASGKTMHLQVAFSYSGRWDIVQASKKIAAAVASGELHQDSIDQELFSKYLSTANVADPDLLIRTGSARRISNFMLWQLSYSECYFSDVFWPDFNDEDFAAALTFYQQQERRFGKTSEQIKEHG